MSLLNLINVLIQPGVPGTNNGIEVVETHISYVLLTGEFAYKIKKPVNLGFVKFSSLEKRKYYCHEELRFLSIEYPRYSNGQIPEYNA